MNKTEMPLSKEIIKCLEDNDWVIEECYEENGSQVIGLGFYTNLGEDYGIYLWFNGTDQDFIRQFSIYADDFDAEDHAVGWYNCHGEHGAPTSIRDLLDDADSIQECMNQTTEDLKEVWDNIPEECFNESDSLLDMLKKCKYVNSVSEAVCWGISYDDLIQLCEGYADGNPIMRTKIIDFLEDINFHTETSQLLNNEKEFIENVMNHTWDF